MHKAIAIALLMFPSAVLAHEFDELKISRFEQSGNFVEIQISETVKGEKINCALFDPDGQLLKSSRSITNNLATKVLIPNPGEPVAGVKCVFD